MIRHQIIFLLNAMRSAQVGAATAEKPEWHEVQMRQLIRDLLETYRRANIVTDYDMVELSVTMHGGEVLRYLS